MPNNQLLAHDAVNRKGVETDIHRIHRARPHSSRRFEMRDRKLKGKVRCQREYLSTYV